MYYKQLIVIIIFLADLQVSFSGYANEQMQTGSCWANPNEEPAREQEFYQTASLQGILFNTPSLHKNSCQTAELHKLEKDSLQKVEALQQDEEFQEIVAEFQKNASRISPVFKDSNTETPGELYIFVSFSMGENALLNLAVDAKRFGATLVLRGFKEASYRKTAHALKKIILKTGQGVIIDPELYSVFGISAVSTFILTKPFQLRPEERIQTPIHDKLQGHVSTHYALELFAKEGDLKDEARSLLNTGAIK